VIPPNSTRGTPAGAGAAGLPAAAGAPLELGGA
jgi:hypothetical protein